LHERQVKQNTQQFINKCARKAKAYNNKSMIQENEVMYLYWSSVFEKGKAESTAYLDHDKTNHDSQQEISTLSYALQYIYSGRMLIFLCA